MQVINILTIDIHVHCFNPKIAEMAICVLEQTAGITPYTRGLVEQTIECFDEWGVDKGVILPIATKPTQQRILNDWVAEQERISDRFLGFGAIHPDAEDAYEELDKIIELGLHGVKLHPDYQGFMADEERLDPLYDEIERRELPVVFHAGFDGMSPDVTHCTPQMALNVIRRHPHMKMIFAHLGGNYRWEEVYDVLAGVDGEVYFDTAFTSRGCTDELMEKIIKKHGADRILFGSDCPWDSSLTIKNKILRLDLSDDDKEKILGGNAVKLLKLQR